ncbi:glycerophosphodiester phosphodiesterase [Streptomyces sp. NPDC059701]|uniref:glycerophosphodiester phosphodiesterase n=1 Tax=Streptomyces sp. NPDC059701 TaxID=3346914 RepID=UPI0036C806B2
MRYQYGSDGGSVVTDAAGNAVVGRPGTVWTARTGGSAVTDLLTLAGAATGGTITTDSKGRIAFQGPDGATATLWWDGGDGTRWAILPTETDRIARAQVDTYGIPAAAAGAAGGVATLDTGGKVPSGQLPDLSSSYVPYPAGGQAGDTLIRGAGSAVTWGRLTAGTVSPWAALEQLPGPRWIAHRGGSLLAPENTIEAYRLADQLGADALELDVYRTADGGLFCMHDTTVDRTSNISGSTAALTVPAALRGRIDAGTWFANSWPNDLRIPLFADVLADIGNTIPMVVHCNNAGSGALAVAEILRQELEQSVLVMAWTEAELVAARAAGIPTVLLDSDGVLSGQTYAGLLAAGTQYLGVDYSQATTATINAAAAAGLRVMVFTVNRRSDYAKLPTGSVWAVISDDPWYVRSGQQMRASDLFGAGTFYHGMVGITDAGDNRGFFQAGTPNWWGLDASGATNMASNGGYIAVMQGYLGPLPNTFTLDLDYVIDVADYTSASMQVAFTKDDLQYDDEAGQGTAAKGNGYNVLVRSSGIIDVYRVAGGTPTSIGTVTTAAITAGSSQHLRIQMTGTQIIVTRTNIAAPNSVTCTDSTYRGSLYPHLGVRDTKTRWANVTVS